jgi:hypothetical protein
VGVGTTSGRVVAGAGARVVSGGRVVAGAAGAVVPVRTAAGGGDAVAVRLGTAVTVRRWDVQEEVAGAVVRRGAGTVSSGTARAGVGDVVVRTAAGGGGDASPAVRLQKGGSQHKGRDEQQDQNVRPTRWVSCMGSGHFTAARRSARLRRASACTFRTRASSRPA